MSKILGITGATGYVGEAVMRAAAASGWQVVVIGRRHVESARAWRFADLGVPPQEGLLGGLDAVLHLAADTRGKLRSPSAEVAFARNLATQAAATGVLMIFASSQAAAAQAPSDYGRTKFAIEQEILPLGAVVIRPGLVVGGHESGLFGVLVALTRNSWVLPDLFPRPLVQPIHVDDLAAAMLAACQRRDISGRILTVAGSPIPFIDLLSGIAHYRLRVRRIRLPVPLLLIRNLLIFVSPILGAQFSPARLDSLTQLPVIDTGADLNALDIALRPFSNMLDRRGLGIRELLVEGRALVRALTGSRPSSALLRRYVVTLKKLDHSEALHLPAWLLARPAWLAALDTLKLRNSDSGDGLALRMNLASRLAEADPDMADLFLMSQSRSGKFVAVKDLVRASIREIHGRLVAPVARQAARKWL